MIIRAGCRPHFLTAGALLGGTRTSPCRRLTAEAIKADGNVYLRYSA